MQEDLGEKCQHAGTEAGELILINDQIITANQVAALILKPSNAVLNANSTPKNINSIIGRFEQTGWQLQAVKVFAGSSALIGSIIAHYSKPFFDSQFEDVRTQLTRAERQRLVDIWGEAAESYPICHPVRLADSGFMDYATIGSIWHAGRGANNQLLESGSVSGINTITPVKDARYGQRRLLLVKDYPKSPNGQPFFIVNGFTAELVMKFSRSGEHIVIMGFSQKHPQYDLEYMREHVIGKTNPHKAVPGSIRFDALHADEYGGAFPIESLDEVGIENNIVHFSDSLAEAYRELTLWLPELMWYPSTGPFAPDVSFTMWKTLCDRYLAHQLESSLANVTNPSEEILLKWSMLPEPASPVTTSVNMMAGGSGGRFFGYELPERQRNKLFAPIVPIHERTYSFLELQLARLTGLEYVKQINILAAENTSAPIWSALEDLRDHTPGLRSTIEKTAVQRRRGIPRIVPLAQDLFADSKFQAHCAQHGKDPWDEALSLCHQPGNILQDRGIIASKPPGHLSVFLHYIYFRLQEELSRGIDVAYFHIGEDAAGIPDVRLLAHAKANNAVAYVGVVKSYMPQSGGYLISNDGRLQLHEGGDIGITAPFYLNTCRIAINLPALACFLASDVEAFMGLDEFHIRRAVQQKILDMLIPRVEIKPLNNYTLWAGQFAYVLGQISEAVPTEFILCDEPFPELLTFKTREELANILPVIEQAYAPYLNYLELHSDRT